MKKISLMLAAVLVFAGTLFAQENPGKGFQQYTLKNGMTVYLWEDSDQPDVFGKVIVRAGSIDEPVNYTGLAHYLEHMLFKGTETIGALDWTAEKPLYQDIIRLYDEYAATTDQAKRDELTKQINEKSMQAAKFTATDDFSNLVEGIGGEGLNAYTSYDLTAYHNSFPSFEMERWMALYSDRLINPVYRSFQAELENVFEEYNISQDDPMSHLRDFWFDKLFEGTPYARSVIGTADHLKNPSMTPMINFFNTWYVPNNMALVLVGNFNSAEVKPLIEKYFGRLESKPLPAREAPKGKSFDGNPIFKTKIGYQPMTIWGYNGVKSGDKDELVIETMLGLLNNDHSTGLLDKLMLDGTLGLAYASNMSFRDLGRIIIQGVPYFDPNQRIYESERTTSRLIMAEVDKVKNGNIADSAFLAVKAQMLQQATLMFESSSSKVNILTDAFTYLKPVDDYLKMADRINAITLADVQAAAKKYLSGSYITLSSSDGDPKKDKIKKPSIKPLDPPKGVETAYSIALKAIPTGTVTETYNNFADVKTQTIGARGKLFWTENKKNDIFSLTFKYGVGTKKMPKLQYAAQLLSSAGMFPNLSGQDLRNKFSKLGASYSYAADDSYFYISIYGEEKNLAEICRQMALQTLMPKLDNRQIESVVGSAIASRMYEKKNSDTQTAALMEYVQYKDRSRYIDRIPVEELYKVSVVGDVLNVNYLLSNTDLTTTIQEAISYAVDVHFVGKTPADQVAKIIGGTIKSELLPTESPFVRERESYDQSTIFFLPNSDMQQAKVYFYFNGEKFNIADEVSYDAFNQYFSGGFSGLVMNEIREKRSMAYTAYGAMVTPSVPNQKGYFIGYVGTQSDKVADAVDVYMDLLTNMPIYPDRIDNIKTYLRQSSLTAKPSFRSKSFTFDAWEKMGYKDDPARVNMPKVNALTFDQILAFYDAKVKGQPIVIVIVGDPKMINTKQIEKKWGKITKISSSRLFKGGF